MYGRCLAESVCNFHVLHTPYMAAFLRSMCCGKCSIRYPEVCLYIGELGPPSKEKQSPETMSSARFWGWLAKACLLCNDCGITLWHLPDLLMFKLAGVMPDLMMLKSGRSYAWIDDVQTWQDLFGLRDSLWRRPSYYHARGRFQYDSIIPGTGEKQRVSWIRSRYQGTQGFW